MRFARLWACALLFAACGKQQAAGSQAVARSLAIAPGSVSLQAGAVQVFTASGAGPVAWSVAEPGAGSITAGGTYSAPQNAGTYHVVAQAAGLTATAEVKVLSPAARPGIVVRIDPPGATLEPGASAQFAAATLGARTPAVTWSVQEGASGGTVDGNGVYVAPPAPGSYHVVATSVDEPSVHASAVITVALPVVRVAISPQAITVAPGAPLQFAALVTGAQDAGVTWSSDCGEVAADGSLTAPAQEGTWHVIAHSLADASVMATATVVVDATPRRIDPLAVTLAAGEAVDFKAQGSISVVEGAEGGSVTPAGRYRAPRDRGGVFHVAAGGSTATVTVVPPDLIDHGGPLEAATRTFAVFWGNPAKWAADVRTLQEELLRGLDGSSYLALADQYLRGATASSRFAASLVDLSPPPSSPGQADSATVGAEACNALRAGGITPSPGDVVFVYGSAPLSPAPSWCAWHSTYACGGATLLVAFVPNVTGSWSCLALGSPKGCNQATADANATASLTAHELMEAMTDPFGSAWTDADGQELGDKCEDQPRCVALSTGTFQLQAEYSNAAHACVP